MQPHFPNKPRRESCQTFKNAADPFKLVIVRYMWLTGFDAPCMHTTYVDKPMSGHGLMQAIARVNRVFKDKPGGLVVDYLGLVDLWPLTRKAAGNGKTAIDQEEAVAVMWRNTKSAATCSTVLAGRCELRGSRPSASRQLARRLGDFSEACAIDDI